MEKTTIKMMLEELNNVYDEDLEKFGRNFDGAYDIIRMILNGTDVPASIALNLIKNDYDRHQQYELIIGLERGLDVSAYADPLFHEYQMREIREGLIAGVDVSIYADPKYNSEQMKEIRRGLEEGLDVSIYADPMFNCHHMAVLRRGLEYGVDASVYANPNLSVREMIRIRDEMRKSMRAK